MKVHDEVCGMTIEAETAATSVEFQDKRYHFCTVRCRQKFEEHPEWYVPISGDGTAEKGHGGNSDTGKGRR